MEPKRREQCVGMLHRGAQPDGAPNEPPPKPRKPSWRGLAVFLAALVVVCGLVWLLGRPRASSPREGLGKSFELDLSRFNRIDPALLVCIEREPIRLGLSLPEGLAVGPDGALFVCGDEVLLKLSPAGEELARWALDAAPQCVAVHPDGSLYLGVGDHVEIYNREGVRQTAWKSVGENGLVSSIAFVDEYVYVADAGNSRVLKYDWEGRPVKTLPGFVLFSSPHFDLAVDPDGALWIVNPGGRELRKYDAEDDVVLSWKRVARTIEGFSGCCNPMHVAFRPDGSLVTSEKNIPRVKILSPEGELLGVVAGPDEFAGGAKSLDLAVDAGNRILVLDPQARQVRVFVDRDT